MAGVLAGQPFDMVKVKMQTAGHRVFGYPFMQQPQYHGTMHCISNVMEHGGVRSLYKGPQPRHARCAMRLLTPRFPRGVLAAARCGGPKGHSIWSIWDDEVGLACCRRSRWKLPADCVHFGQDLPAERQAASHAGGGGDSRCDWRVSK